MRRKAIFVIASLILFVAEVQAGPTLPPGKPAGVKKAQESTNGAIAVGALVLIAVGGFAISSHPYKLPGATASTSTQP